jgi:hypothetical protein
MAYTINGFVLLLFVSAAFRSVHPNGNLLLRVYPAGLRIPGLVQRKWLNAGQMTRPGGREWVMPPLRVWHNEG